MAVGPSGGFMKKLFAPKAMKKKERATAGMAKANPSGTPMGDKVFGKKK